MKIRNSGAHTNNVYDVSPVECMQIVDFILDMAVACALPRVICNIALKIVLYGKRTYGN